MKKKKTNRSRTLPIGISEAMIRQEKARVREELKKAREAEKKHRETIPDEVKTAAIKSYLDKEGTMSQVAQAHGISYNQFRHILKAAGHVRKAQSRRKDGAKRVKLLLCIEPEIFDMLQATGQPPSTCCNEILRKYFARRKS